MSITCMNARMVAYSLNLKLNVGVTKFKKTTVPLRDSVPVKTGTAEIYH